MYISIYLCLFLFNYIISAAPIKDTIPPITSPLQKRVTELTVTCRNGIFQNPDEDIAEDVCVAKNKCRGGDIATEEITDEGELFWTTTCVDCPNRAGVALTGCEIVGTKALNITAIAT